MRIGAVIAAAGAPGGFRSYDELEHTDGSSMIRRMIYSFRRAGVEDIAVVTGYKAEETEKTLEKTMSLIKAAIDDTENEKIKLPHRLPGWRIIRKASPAVAGENKKLSVSKRCTGCGVCAAICPMENISIENGKAVINSNCIKCFACYHRCPVNAIEYGKAQGQYKGLVKTEELRRR